MRQKPAINIGGLDNLVRYFGTPEEAAELRTLRQKADRAAELERDRDDKPKPEGISTITAVALGMAIGQAAQEQAAGVAVQQDARQAGKATLRRQSGPQRPALALVTPQPA